MGEVLNQRSGDKLQQVFEQDARGRLPGDRASLAWRYATIEVQRPAELDELLAISDPALRALRLRELWRGILDEQRSQRRLYQRPRARNVYIN